MNDRCTLQESEQIQTINMLAATIIFLLASGSFLKEYFYPQYDLKFQHHSSTTGVTNN